eukprot:TRINITY_DN13145_c0_g1_i1.p2 TRINITY_DN13145_c0_g1~~TRINITY_DN13145_c0_g1_i1.p2  ORF type:complete len:112 (-),score=0.47 TRINITY_DN13145_c0_g1_i1:57-392(-)
MGNSEGAQKIYKEGTGQGGIVKHTCDGKHYCHHRRHRPWHLVRVASHTVRHMNVGLNRGRTADQAAFCRNKYTGSPSRRLAALIGILGIANSNPGSSQLINRWTSEPEPIS